MGMKTITNLTKIMIIVTWNLILMVTYLKAMMDHLTTDMRIVIRILPMSMVLTIIKDLTINQIATERLIPMGITMVVMVIKDLTTDMTVTERLIPMDTTMV